MSGPGRVPTWVQYVLLALVWGASFLFMKVGLEGLSPFQVVLARLGVGALTLLAVNAAAHQPLPRDRALWVDLLVVTLLLCVVPFLLFPTAEQHVTSGLAGIYNATTPLMTLAVSMVALPAESRSRPSRAPVTRWSACCWASRAWPSCWRRGRVMPGAAWAGSSPASARRPATAWASPGCGCG